LSASTSFYTSQPPTKSYLHRTIWCRTTFSSSTSPSSSLYLSTTIHLYLAKCMHWETTAQGTRNSLMLGKDGLGRETSKSKARDGHLFFLEPILLVHFFHPKIALAKFETPVLTHHPRIVKNAHLRAERAMGTLDNPSSERFDARSFRIRRTYHFRQPFSLFVSSPLICPCNPSSLVVWLPAVAGGSRLLLPVTSCVGKKDHAVKLIRLETWIPKSRPKT